MTRNLYALSVPCLSSCVSGYDRLDRPLSRDAGRGGGWGDRDEEVAGALSDGENCCGERDPG